MFSLGAIIFRLRSRCRFVSGHLSPYACFGRFLFALGFVSSLGSIFLPSNWSLSLSRVEESPVTFVIFMCFRLQSVLKLSFRWTPTARWRRRLLPPRRLWICRSSSSSSRNPKRRLIGNENYVHSSTLMVSESSLCARMNEAGNARQIGVFWKRCPSSGERTDGRLETFIFATVIKIPVAALSAVTALPFPSNDSNGSMSDEHVGHATGTGTAGFPLASYVSTARDAQNVR